ncbi:SseB family protein [Paeniglutamicibacter sp. NPDC091659]|uniref:SseB family protein n=1 Tax=Paeniglutamicibacter sp. NPDC091659 TaxID=3364389 RepID=UPI00382E0BF9
MSANSPSSHGAPESPRHLPGHIAAALARAGSQTDSAGQSWEGRDLSGEGNPLHNFDNDNGLIDEKLAAAIDALVAGTGSEQGVHAALAESRIYIAVVAQLAEGGLGEHGFTEDKEADMALVTLNAPDGRKALPVFSSVERLQAWHGEARPVAVYAPRAALSAVAEEAQMLVLDPGADFTFVLRRPGMWALAQQKDWTPSYLNEELAAIVARQAGTESALASIRIAPGQGVGSRTAQGTSVPGGGSGPELRLEFTFQPGVDEASARACVTRIHAALAANADFAENVDSLEVALKAGAPTQAGPNA